MNRNFLEEYNNHLIPHLPELKNAIEGKLRYLVEDAGITLHSLGGRVKTRSSLEKKLASPDRSYGHILDVTDLLAFRLVTYSEALISDIAKLIENTFDVDFQNSVNKLQHEDAQKFGYRSLHYICKLSEEDKKQFPEFIKEFKFEIQIRTGLQHIWAEIEHNIGYKASEQLPSELRRRFSLIASLLEISDREFDSIRQEVKKYKNDLQKANFQQEQIELDLFSLQSLLKKEELVNLDKTVSQFLQLPLVDDYFYSDYILRVLHAANLKRVDTLLTSMVKLQGSLHSFLPAYFHFAKSHWNLDPTTVQKGYGLLFLAHLHILNSEELFINKVNSLTKFYSEVDYPNEPVKTKNAAQSLIAVLKKFELA